MVMYSDSAKPYDLHRRLACFEKSVRLPMISAAPRASSRNTKSISANQVSTPSSGTANLLNESSGSR